MAAVTNAEFAKTLPLPAHLQEQAAAFADAKSLSLAGRDVVAEDRNGKLMLIVTADAALALALSAGRNFAPISTEFTGDGREWVDVWLSGGPPAACRVTFEVEDIDAPVRVTHTWGEYTQGRVTGTQRTMPALMLAKATMQLGLRRIAPQALAGLYSQEEAEAAESGAIAQAEHVEQVQQAVTPTPDVEAKGSSKSRAEQRAERKDELVRIGKALRAECGDEAAATLSGALTARGCDPNEMTAADLKALVAVAKRAREDFERAQAAPPVDDAPAAEPDTASKGSHADAQEAWSKIGELEAGEPSSDPDEFVI